MAKGPDTQVGIIIVGAGLIGPRHAQAVLDSQIARLVAIIDPLPVTKTIAADLGVKWYRDIDAFFVGAPEKPAAAIICTPNATHVSVGKRLIEAGIHVLVEKPISTDIESGRALINLAKQKDVKVLVGHHRRFNPYVIAAKEAITTGKVGNIVAVNGFWTIQKPDEYFNGPGQWRRSGASGGGVILINMIHDVDILHHLIGPIVRVYAERIPSRRGFDAEEGAAVTLRFQSGVVGTFLLSDNVVSPHNFEAGTGENPMIPPTRQDFYRIFGSEGTLSVPDMTSWSYGSEKKSWNKEMKSESLVVSSIVPFQAQIEHFVEVVRGQSEPSCSGEAGLAALAVCEAIKKSMVTRMPVDIEH